MCHFVVAAVTMVCGFGTKKRKENIRDLFILHYHKTRLFHIPLTQCNAMIRCHKRLVVAAA
jgi:hypothetical protein